MGAKAEANGFSRRTLSDRTACFELKRDRGKSGSGVCEIWNGLVEGAYVSRRLITELKRFSGHADILTAIESLKIWWLVNPICVCACATGSLLGEVERNAMAR